jgi:hypothetical protein
MIDPRPESEMNGATSNRYHRGQPLTRLWPIDAGKWDDWKNGGQVCAITQPVELQTILAIETLKGEAGVVWVTHSH